MYYLSTFLYIIEPHFYALLEHIIWLEKKFVLFTIQVWFGAVMIFDKIISHG